MATAKAIQEYLLEHGEGWKQFGSQCAKLDSPNFCKAILFSKSGFDVWSTHATIADSISQEELDFLTLTQAIQLINEKTGDNIPLPQQQNKMSLPQETIKELEDFGFEKRKYKSTKGDVYIFENQYCKIKCYPKRFFILFDSEASMLAYEASTKIEEEIPFPPNLGLIKTIYKEVFGQELQPKPKQKDYSFSALCNEGKVLVQHNYYSPTEDISQAVTLYAKLMHVRWEIEKGINNHEGGLVTLLSDGRIKGFEQEIDQEEWQNYYLVFAKKEQAKVFAASEENMRIYKEFLHYNNQ